MARAVIRESAAAGNTPPRTLPLLYLGTAHISLALAFLFAGIWPEAVAGFFYHAWLIALVHLITLGWISFSIIGAFYIVGPLALRVHVPVRRLDYVAYGFAVIGVVGMVGHFWIQEFAGMSWSAATVATGAAYMTVRIAATIGGAPIQRAVKVHIVLACVNFWIAASMGLLIAFDKVTHFLGGFVLANVFAHAHLAAIGWAMMMAIGVGYRLLPMMIPAKMPGGRSPYASAILLEAGVLGLFTTLLLRSRWATAFGTLIVAGLFAFAALVVRMLRHRVSKPVGAPRVDFGLLHAAAAAISLVAAATIGMGLLIAPMSPRTLHAAAAYGVFGLVGCLAQMVVAMEARLLPMATWYWAYAATGYRVPPPSPFAMRDRALQAIVFGGWSVGVPALAAGMYLESARLVCMGAWALFAAVAIATVDNVFVIAHSAARTRPGSDNGTVRTCIPVRIRSRRSANSLLRPRSRAMNLTRQCCRPSTPTASRPADSCCSRASMGPALCSSPTYRAEKPAR